MSLNLRLRPTRASRIGITVGNAKPLQVPPCGTAKILNYNERRPYNARGRISHPSEFVKLNTA